MDDSGKTVRASGGDGRGPEPARRLGKFELIEAVGRGGFGEVWKAREAGLDRFVALKFLQRRSGNKATHPSARRETSGGVP